jgi:hypothetical protein
MTRRDSGIPRLLQIFESANLEARDSVVGTIEPAYHLHQHQRLIGYNSFDDYAYLRVGMTVFEFGLTGLEEVMIEDEMRMWT